VETNTASEQNSNVQADLGWPDQMPDSRQWWPLRPTAHRTAHRAAGILVEDPSGGQQAFFLGKNSRIPAGTKGTFKAPQSPTFVVNRRSARPAGCVYVWMRLSVSRRWGQRPRHGAWRCGGLWSPVLSRETMNGG